MIVQAPRFNDSNGSRGSAAAALDAGWVAQEATSKLVVTAYNSRANDTDNDFAEGPFITLFLLVKFV